jgi:ribosomal protein S18 acetylase RimI-like enzyme
MTTRPKAKTGTRVNLIDVNAHNLEERGFFCYMSKRKSEGYGRKLSWLKERFAEGMRLKMLTLPERGFIEYTPGEHAWRAVHADGYMFIHCLWVVGKGKGKGFGSALLNACIEDAKKSKMKGVAIVTSEKIWLVGKRILESNGFERVDEAPPAFSLMVKRLGDSTSPCFAGNWDEKARACGNGLTVIRSDQCPYIVDATAQAVESAQRAGIDTNVVELKSRDDLMRLSPTPYGVFGLVLKGKTISYHYLLEKDLMPLLTDAPLP